MDIAAVFRIRLAVVWTKSRQARPAGEEIHYGVRSTMEYTLYRFHQVQCPVTENEGEHACRSVSNQTGGATHGILHD